MKRSGRAISKFDRVLSVVFFGFLFYLAYLAYEGRLLEKLESVAQAMGDLVF